MSNETMLSLLEEKETSYDEVLNNVKNITKKINNALQVNFESFVNYVNTFSEIVRRLIELTRKCNIPISYKYFEISGFRIYFEGHMELKYYLHSRYVSKQDLLKDINLLFENETFIQAFSTIESTKEIKERFCNEINNHYNNIMQEYEEKKKALLQKQDKLNSIKYTFEAKLSDIE